MIVLDTNVVSEMMRPAPNPAVEAWFTVQDGATLYITAVTAAELLFGLAISPAGRRRTERARMIADLLGLEFRDRILPFGQAAASHYASIGAARQAAGRPIGTVDCQIAAITRANGATVATRDWAGFQGCGIDIIDPWQAA